MSYHDISSKNPENIVEEKADEKNASNLVTAHRNLLDGLNTKGNAEEVVHHEVLRLHIHSGEDDRNDKTKNFLQKHNYLFSLLFVQKNCENICIFLCVKYGM